MATDLSDLSEPTTPPPPRWSRILATAASTVTLLAGLLTGSLTVLHDIGLPPVDHRPAEPTVTVVIVCPGRPALQWPANGGRSGPPDALSRPAAAGERGRVD
ncbi:hypothetical protein [Actinacidiphila reveromycinica]|uniref:hypothetical protein n=1 Tax=Actinacidiphila reveromycinica TaxID=659352 RepID=UPI001923D484|nr:hypothetical protein [Streptomyces sp. SN-593]